MTTRHDAIVPPLLQSAKAAFRGLVAAFGGQEASAAETGKTQSRIAAYCSQNCADMPPADVIDALEDRTVGMPGWPHFTLWLCRRRGGMFVHLPDPNRAAPSRWNSYIALLGKEVGELTHGICSDLSDDNDISPGEARKRLEDAADLVRVAVNLEAALKARAGEI